MENKTRKITIEIPPSKKIASIEHRIAKLEEEEVRLTQERARCRGAIRRSRCELIEAAIGMEDTDIAYSGTRRSKGQIEQAVLEVLTRSEIPLLTTEIRDLIDDAHPELMIKSKGGYVALYQHLRRREEVGVYQKNEEKRWALSDTFDRQSLSLDNASKASDSSL